jgi:hypothetical protein
VNVVKGKWLIFIILALVFSGGRIAMAHGSDNVAPSTSNGNSGNSMEGMDMNGKDKNMDMSGTQKNDNMEGMQMDEKPIKEAPPNAKVLGTYGVVNASFILIGIWNKWFRRKGGSNGNSKK